MSELSDAINGQTGGVLRVPYGTHTIDRSVTVKSAVVLEPGADVTVSPSCRITMTNGSAFVGDKVKPMVRKQGADHLFWIAGTDVNIADLEIDNSAATGGYDFLVDTSAGREFIYIDKIKTRDSFGLIADNSNPAGLIVNLHMNDVVALRHRGRGSYLTRAFAFTYLKKCCIDYINSLSPALTNIPAWAFLNVEGLELESVDVLGTAINGASPLQYGFYFENVRALTLNKVMADNCGGFGFTFKACNWIYGDKVKASQGGDIGFVFGGGTQNVYLDQFYAGGRKGIPGDKGQPLYWTDESVHNINMTDGLSQSYSGALFGGVSQSKINFINHKV